MFERPALKRALGWSITLSVFGCGAEVATEPHDASTAKHQSAAGQADGRVRMAGAGPNPNVDCLTSSVGVCWSQAINIERDRERDVEFYRQLAARHRAAVAALVQAEAAACADLAADERDISPFFRRSDVVSVAPLTTDDQGDAAGGVASSRPSGARIVFRPVPGLTEDGLQQSVDCHLARAAALGHDAPELSFCPLMPKGVEAKVSSTARGFAVTVTANDRGSAEEVWRRAAALIDAPSNE